MADIDNNKLMGLLRIAGGGLLLSQEYIYERRKQRQWEHPWIRKRYSRGAYYFIMNDLRSMIKGSFRKSISIEIKIMCFHFLYNTTSGHKCLSKRYLQLMLVSVFTSWN